MLSEVCSKPEYISFSVLRILVQSLRLGTFLPGGTLTPETPPIPNTAAMFVSTIIEDIQPRLPRSML